MFFDKPFKCNLKQLRQCVNISGYMCELYQVQVAETTNIGQINQHYCYSHTMINPTRGR
jgi:putative glutathione S-transferase